MKLFFAALVLSVGFSTMAMSQDAPTGKLSRKGPVAAVSDDPVTQSEARITFQRIAGSLSAVAQKPMNFGASNLPDSSKPLTREQVLFELERLYKGASPDFKVTPRSVWFDPSVLAIKSGPARPLLEKFIKLGFIARVGVFATSKTDTLTVPEFGDTLGIFVARIANLCNMPSTKFTPFIEKPE